MWLRGARTCDRSAGADGRAGSPESRRSGCATGSWTRRPWRCAVTRTRVAVAALACMFVPHLAAAQQRMTWKVEKDTREALVYAPKSPPAGAKLPLVLSFHGHGDDMENFQYVDLQRAWPDA